MQYEALVTNQPSGKGGKDNNMPDLPSDKWTGVMNTAESVLFI